MHVEGRYVCAVCGLVLDHHEGLGWTHPMASREPDDHPVVPVRDTDVPVVDFCDFCYGRFGDPTAFVVPARDFQVLPGHMSDGDWAACAPCAELIERNDWNGLIRRVEQGYEKAEGAPMDPIVLAGLRSLYRKLRKNITGSLKPLP